MVSLQGKRVLLVDDEAEPRSALAEALSAGYGCEVLQAGSVRDGLVLVLNGEVDAVVTDARMPGGSGLELLDGIMALGGARPVVLMVSGVSDGATAQALAKGAFALVGKPYDGAALAASLAAAFTAPKETWTRKYPRVAVSAVVAVAFAGQPQPVEAKLINLGRGGMYIQTAAVLPDIATPLSFTLGFSAAEPAAISGSGVLRWRREDPADLFSAGAGVEFEQLDASCLSRVVEEIALLRPKAFIPDA